MLLWLSSLSCVCMCGHAWSGVKAFSNQFRVSVSQTSIEMPPKQMICGFSDLHMKDDYTKFIKAPMFHKST